MASVISIEPSSQNYQALQANLSSTNSGKIKTLQAAIGAQSGPIKLFKGKAANFSILKDYQLLDQENSYEEVPSHTLEEVMDHFHLTKIDFLKMDCEGAEYEILENASSLILQKIDTISMEFHDLKSEKHNATWICDRLKKEGFRIVKFVYEPTYRNLNFGNPVATRLP